MNVHSPGRSSQGAGVAGNKRCARWYLRTLSPLTRIGEVATPQNRKPSRVSALRVAVIPVTLVMHACGGGPGPELAPRPRPVIATPASPTDSIAVLSRVQQAADEFIGLWRYHWEFGEMLGRFVFYEGPGGDSVTARAVEAATWGPPRGIPKIELAPAEFSSAVVLSGAGPLDRDGRGSLVHCHPDVSEARFPRVHAYIIESGIGKRAICPSWYPIDQTPPWDERRAIDAPLVAPLRRRIVAARSRLLDELDWAASILPADAWITGQRVRFALDQSDTVRAERAAAGCRAPEWWCTALGGYLVHARGDHRRSDAIFLAMLEQMPADERCRWTDLSALLDDEGRRAYQLVPCAARDSLNRRIWWLSDPLYTEPGNDRRAEHHARLVLASLRAATSLHERWDMRETGGGAAVAEMLVRYGWPNYSQWDGVGADRGHYGYLGIASDTMRAHGRFATAEYAAPRFHSVPTWRAIADPTAAAVYDWTLTANADVVINPADTIWWPVEHFDRAAGPMVQLWNQHVLLRRQDSVLFAIASSFLPEDFPGATGDTLRGALVTGSIDSMRVEPKGAIVGRSNMFRTTIPSRPQLVSLELYGDRPRGIVARTRLGVVPPPPLSALGPGEIAISDPVLVRPPPGDVYPVDDPTRALSLMYGTLVYRNVERVGVYWETYGVNPGDSVELSIRIERHLPPPGVLRRIGFALGIGQRRDAGVGVAWREPRLGSQPSPIPGPVPIHGRNLTLDMSSLEPGDYSLTVTLARLRGTPVVATRPFWILPPLAGDSR